MDPITREEMYLNRIATGSGAVPDPPVTREEHYLSQIAGNIGDLTQPFIVTLTPTSEDLSGTMDKTPTEIFEAYKAGRRIRALVPMLESAFDFTTFVLTDSDQDGEFDTINAGANFWYKNDGQDFYMVILTNEVTSSYWVNAFPLTPA